jgi:Ca-activated chloride channel family protein
MLLDSLSLAWPLLLLLLPLPLFFRPKTRPQEAMSQAVRVPFYGTLARLRTGTDQGQTHPHRLARLAALIAWMLLVFAASRPQWIGEAVTLPQAGRDLMLAVDISPSMKETDMIVKGFQATRLDAVKDVVSEFVEQRRGDRVGLILFGTQPYIQSPLTFDLKTLNTLLREATLGMAGQATAIGDAIGLAVKRLRDKPEQSRVLVLLTDGANTAGEIPPEKAAQLAAKEKIKIYTIGIGAERMVKQGFFSSTVVNPSADLDEEALTSIATLTGGRYFRARNTPELGMIYESLNQLEPVEQEGKTWRPVSELYYLPLGLSLILFALCLLPRLRWISKPATHPSVREETSA